MNSPGPSRKDPIFQLSDQIRETSFALHRHLRHGHVEKVYQNGLLHRLRKQGLAVEKEKQLLVFDEDGTELGEFFADLLVSNQLLVELKAVRAINDEHIAQLLGYLRAARMEHGLLINFGAAKLQIRKLALSDSRFTGEYQ